MVDEGKWLNYIINLENKLKDRFKDQISEKEFDNICPVGTTPRTLYGNPNPAGKYWSPGCPKDIPHQRPQDVP